jgi:hypothetical protein
MLNRGLSHRLTMPSLILSYYELHYCTNAPLLNDWYSMQ